jgi:hypothetical protein
MISAWISEWEKPHLSQVDDKELNDLFQEVNKEFKGKFLIQTTRYDRRTLWDRMTGNYLKTGKLYTLYNMIDNVDAQVINFCVGSGWSINTAVEKHYIMTYLFGLLSGKKHFDSAP